MLKSHGSATLGSGRPVTSISSQQRAVSQPIQTQPQMRPLPPPKRISSAEPFMLPQAQSLDVVDTVTGPKPNPFRPALPSTSSSSTSVTVTPTNPFQMPLSPPPSVISGSSDHHQQQLNSRQPPSLPPRHQSLGRETAAKGTTSNPSVPPYKPTSHVPGTTLSIISSSSSAPIPQVPPPPPRTMSNRSVSSPTPPGQQASGITLLESSTHIGIGPKNIVTAPKKKLATTRASRSNSHLSSATASSSGSGPSGVEIHGQSNLRSDQPVDRPSSSNPASKFQQFATGSIVSIPPPLPPSRRLSSKSARSPKQDPASTPLSGASLGRSRSLSSAQLPAESRSVSAGSITGHGEGPLLPPPRRAPSLSSVKPRGAFKESSLTSRKQDPFASRLAKVQLKPGTGRSAVRDDDRRALRDDSDDDDYDDDGDDDDDDDQDFDSGSRKLFVGDDGQANGVDDDRGLELDDDAMIELEREVRRNSERGWKAL